MSYHLVVIGYVWPEPNSSAAGENMMGLLTAFTQKRWRVTFLSAAAETAHMVDLPALGIEVKHINVNCSEFNSLIRELAPNAVVFDRFMIEERNRRQRACAEQWTCSQHCFRACGSYTCHFTGAYGLRKGKSHA